MTLVLLPTPGRTYRTPSGFRVKVRQVSALGGVPTVWFQLTRRQEFGARPRRKPYVFSVPACEWAHLLADGVPHELRSNG